MEIRILFCGIDVKLFQLCLTKVGAIIALFLIASLQILTCMRITVSSLITAIKKRPRNPRKQKQDAEEEEDPATVI